MASGTQARCWLALAALLVAFASSIALAPVATAAATATSTSSTVAAPQVRLLDESPVVVAPGTTLNLAFTDSGPAARAGATVRLTLFARLTTLSGLQAAIGSPGPSVPLEVTSPITASCITSGGQLRLSVSVAPDGQRVAARQLCGHRDPVLRLGCATQCDGVYPLRISVTADGTTATLVTLVTYASQTSDPLRVAWVLRVAGRSHGVSHATGALTALDAHPTVPMTVDVEGSTVAAALASNPAGTATGLGLLRAAVAARAHELIAEPYVDADLGALHASGLRTEVVRQFALDTVVLRLAGIDTEPVSSVTYGTGPQTPTMANALASIGIDRLLVAGRSLSTDPDDTLSWGSAFQISGATGTLDALSDDTSLDALSATTQLDPGLSAAQFLGELAFLHFEQPDLPQSRAAVVVTTLTRDVTTPFVDAVLRGLAANPVLTSVTASEAFDQVAVGANGFPSVRSLSLGRSKPFNSTTIGLIKFLRITTDGLSSAVTAGATPIPSIEGQLLAAERVMSPTVRVALLNKVHIRLEDELGYFHIDAGSITLTGQGASLPITVLSSAPFTVRGLLRLSSPRIAFPSGATRSISLAASVRSVRISARALTSGDIPLTVTLTSPDGRVVLARAQIIVRATPTSIVGIALTIGSILVLVLWWLRTARRKGGSH